MKFCIWVILLITLLTSCREDRWSSKTENRFLLGHIIDTTQYKTIEELYLSRKVNKIITSDSINNQGYFHFYSPLIYDNKYVYIEKKYHPNKDKNIILKLDHNGALVDSIIINKYSTIINNFIIEKDSYISWFIDNNKEIKQLENITYFSKSDTTKLKRLIKSLKNNNIAFYSEVKNSSNSNIDTCNFIISFKNNKLQKFNYSKNIHSQSLLEIIGDNNISYDFSEKYKELSLATTNFYNVDNFFANTHKTFIPGNKPDFNLYINGGGMDPCNLFYGTYFITLQSGIKLKNMNQSMCDDKKPQEFSDYRSYMDKSLNFIMISDVDPHLNSVLYILKK
ncbi:hypothetical protein [Chryseobacterium taiwanense]|uniref:Uncharacterized protein n=1 Tax=Chryseobacterium taiwanense TaxID=363331 RepID=A0A0B4DI04_9FLAO|nr:hypothetical protein [Chryseobacterium taiwanense]KIC64065.1 hypothetical protein RM51_04935 [Chryseobacterium taiwanense]